MKVTRITRPPHIRPSRVLGWLALAALVAAIVATVLMGSGTGLIGNVQFFAIIATILVAVLAVAVRSVEPRDFARGRELGAKPEQIAVAAPAGPARTRIARTFAVLALVCLAIGSALVAVVMTWFSIVRITGGGGEDPGLALAILFFSIWPPTLMLTWALGTAAFMAKGTLDPPIAVAALVAGIVGSLFVLLPASALPGGAPIVLVALYVGAIQFFKDQFWTAAGLPVSR
jgi:hypothetical protein